MGLLSDFAEVLDEPVVDDEPEDPDDEEDDPESEPDVLADELDEALADEPEERLSVR